MSVCASYGEECGPGYSVPEAARIPVADPAMSVTMALCASCAEEYDNLDGLVAVEDAFGFRVEADGRMGGDNLR